MASRRSLSRRTFCRALCWSSRLTCPPCPSPRRGPVRGRSGQVAGRGHRRSPPGAGFVVAGIDRRRLHDAGRGTLAGGRGAGGHLRRQADLAEPALLIGAEHAAGRARRSWRWTARTRGGGRPPSPPRRRVRWRGASGYPPPRRWSAAGSRPARGRRAGSLPAPLIACSARRRAEAKFAALQFIAGLLEHVRLDRGRAAGVGRGGARLARPSSAPGSCPPGGSARRRGAGRWAARPGRTPGPSAGPGSAWPRRSR